MSRTGGGAAPRAPFVPDTIPSILTPNDLALIRFQFGIPPEYDLELPSPTDRASSPPAGRFCLYWEALRAGLRLPLPPFVVALFRFLHISLASVAPNSFRFLVGFLCLCELAEVRPTISLFRSCYTFKCNALTKDWWYVAPQSRKKGLLKGAPSSIHNWKGKYFFVKCSSLELGLPPWGYIRESVRRAPSLGAADLESLKKLRAYHAPDLSELLEEQTLFNLGLSPLDPAGN